MKIFLDTAETDVIRKNFATGLVDGLTTNPTLIMKSGRNPEEVYEEFEEWIELDDVEEIEIVSLCDKGVSGSITIRPDDV